LPASTSRPDLQSRLPCGYVRLPPSDPTPTNSQRFRKVSSLHLAVDRRDVEGRQLLDFPLVEKLRFVHEGSAISSARRDPDALATEFLSRDVEFYFPIKDTDDGLRGDSNSRMLTPTSCFSAVLDHERTMQAA
jgi:hypothetical protein